MVTPPESCAESERSDLCNLEFNGHIVIAESIVAIVYNHLTTMREML